MHIFKNSQLVYGRGSFTSGSKGLPDEYSLAHCGLHCCKSWSAQAWKLLGNVHMCPSLCASMYTAPVYKGWPSSSFSVQGVSKFVHMLCTNWTLAWAHVYISKQFPSLGTPTSTAVLSAACRRKLAFTRRLYALLTATDTTALYLTGIPNFRDGTGRDGTGRDGTGRDGTIPENPPT